MFSFKKKVNGVVKQEDFECECCGTLDDQAAAGASSCTSTCNTSSNSCCGPVKSSCCSPVSSSCCDSSVKKPQD